MIARLNFRVDELGIKRMLIGAFAIVVGLYSLWLSPRKRDLEREQDAREYLGEENPIYFTETDQLNISAFFSGCFLILFGAPVFLKGCRKYVQDFR